MPKTHIEKKVKTAQLSWLWSGGRCWLQALGFLSINQRFQHQPWLPHIDEQLMSSVRHKKGFKMTAWISQRPFTSQSNCPSQALSRNQNLQVLQAVRFVSDDTSVFHSSSTPSNERRNGLGMSCVGNFDRQDIKIRRYADAEIHGGAEDISIDRP